MKTILDHLRIPRSSQRWCSPWGVGLFAAITAGIVFRLIWIQDIEYKGDEVWTFTRIEAFWRTHELPPLGMPASAGIPNAGMSLWAFVAISAFLPTIDPLSVTRAVQVTNVIAILLLLVFVVRCIPQPEREPWLWSVALVSVNPLSVLFSRKLWPPDILSPFTLSMLVGWWYRGYWWGASLWGFAGALLGQINLTAFLFAAAFLVFVLLFDRRSVHWPGWLCGSTLGALPLVPLLVWLIEHDPFPRTRGLQNPLSPFVHWISLSLGIDLEYSLGRDLASFLAYPNLGPYSTYLAAILLGAIVLIFAVLLLRIAAQLRDDLTGTLNSLFGTHCSTPLALNAAFIGYSLLLLMTLQPIHLHYFAVAFSLPALWLAWIAKLGCSGSLGSVVTTRRLLGIMVLIQACVTFLFLSYIRDVQVIEGDYGTSYGAQTGRPNSKP